MQKKNRLGICKLTGRHGQYVASHIIPLALTRLSRTGEKHLQVEIGRRVTKHSSSWYDDALVIREGEEILARIDSNAIDELRAYGLIWSAWEPLAQLKSNDIVYGNGIPLYRMIELRQPRVLQSFFLSLLWRSAASTRSELKNILLSESTLEDVRNRVRNDDPGRLEDYPIQLFQIITRGVEHNRTPILERKPLLNPDGSEGPMISYVRFYFDGLVAHVHLAPRHEVNSVYLKTCLGFQEKTIVFVHEYESSRASRDIQEMVAFAMQERMKIQTPLKSIVSAIRTQWPSSDN